MALMLVRNDFLYSGDCLYSHLKAAGVCSGTGDRLVNICTTGIRLLENNHRALHAYVHIKHVILIIDYSTVSTANQKACWKL